MTSSTQVFARTAKGDLELTGNKHLSAGLINVLSVVDGESNIAELSARSGLSRAVLETALEILLEEEMVKLGLQKTLAAAPSPASSDQERQSGSKPQSRNDPTSQDENLSPTTDFLGNMMREVQHDLGLDQQGGSVPSAPPAVSGAKGSKSSTTAILEPGKTTLIERAQRKSAEAQVTTQTPEQEAARHQAKMGARVGAERYAKLKADAELKTKARETEFLAAAARTKEMVIAKAQAEAEAKEEERKQLALEEEARAQAAAADAKLTAETEARAREAAARRRAEEESSLKAAEYAKAKAEAEAEARRRAEEEAGLKAEAEVRAEHQARLKADAETRAKDNELKRLAVEAESRAQAAAEEARRKAEAAACAREEKARLEAETKAQAEAEYQTRLKAEAAYQARLEAEAEAKEEKLKRLTLKAEAREQAAAADTLLKAEANAKEEELNRLALEAKARAQAAAADAKTREEEADRRAEEEARSKAHAEAEYQARIIAEEGSRAASELIAREEARVEQAVEARARVRTAELPPDYDQFGLPDLPMAPEEVGARSALHPVESPAALREPRRKSPAEFAGPAEQESYPYQDIKDDDVPTPAHKREDERSSGFSPAQRKPKATDSPDKFDALTQVRVRRSRAGIPWGKIVAVSLVLIVVAALGALHLVSQTQLRQETERILTETLGKPVSVATATIELFPSPLVRFESVKIGEPAMVRISQIKAIPDTRAWLNGTKVFKAAELGSVGFGPESYESIFELLLAARMRPKLPVRRVVIPRMEVAPNGLGLATVAAELEFIPDGGLRKVVFTSKTGQMTVDLDPQESHFELTLSAQSWRLPGTDVDMDSLHAAGQLKKNEFIIADINGRVYGGRIDGKGSLRWSDRWSLNGTFKANGIDIERLPAVPVVSQGTLGLNGRFEAAADDSASLISRLKVGGKFSVQDGKLSGIDIARVLDERPKDVFGGVTPFKTLDGVFQTSTKGHELRDMRLRGGSLSASGHASLSSNKELSGRMAATLNISRRQMQDTLYVSGTAAAPQFRVEK